MFWALFCITLFSIFSFATAAPVRRDSYALNYLPALYIDEWMQPLSSSRLLTQLSWPGSHDTMTAHLCHIPGIDSFGQTQDLWVGQQLDIGVRALDLRLGFHSGGDELIIYHGPLPITPRQKGHMPHHISVTHLFAGLEAWLELHPTEALLVSVKMEHDGIVKAASAASAILARMISRNPSKYHLSDWTLGVPSLKDVRGKMTFIGRFDYEDDSVPILGVHMGFPENIAHKSFIVGANIPVHLEDKYALDTGYNFRHFAGAGREKAAIAISNLEAAAARPTEANEMYITFTSAFQAVINQFPWIVPITPRKFARMVNPLISDWLWENQAESSNYGLVFMDYVYEDLVKQVYNVQ